MYVYYVEPQIDLQETPPSSPKQNNQQTSSADNMLPVEGVPHHRNREHRANFHLAVRVRLMISDYHHNTL